MPGQTISPQSRCRERGERGGKGRQKGRAGGGGERERNTVRGEADRERRNGDDRGVANISVYIKSCAHRMSPCVWKCLLYKDTHKNASVCVKMSQRTNHIVRTNRNNGTLQVNLN